MAGDLKDQLAGLQSHLNKFINRINGDDWTPSLISEITNTLNAIDKNSESQKINKQHFDKLILFSRISMDTMVRLSEYISNLNIRYTSENANKNLLDKTLDDFTFSIPTLEDIKEENVEKK
jgi:hypothetical protein|tara:strand:+ start:165 stop:527 length:363 start_codon:yes stop_codon:yes gene_type:complete